MKIKSIEDKINIIDDIMSPTQIKTFNQLLGNSIHWDTDLDVGTSVMRNEFFRDNKIESIYEQFQFSAVERRKDDFNDVKLDDFTPALTHIVYFPLMQWCLHKNYMLKYEDIIRCKINLQTRAPENSRGKFNAPHCDLGPVSEEKYLTALYYVNDSGGDTYFFNESLDKINDVKNLDNLNILTKVSAKAGRLVVFPSNIVHAGSHPIENNYRIVINYNFCLKMRYGFEEYEEKRKKNYGNL